MSQLFNSERLIDNPTVDSQIENEHRHRYSMAAMFAKGKRVLDAACGSGYGSVLLAEQAQSVTGIDYSADVIAYCQTKYQMKNLFYRQMSVTELDFPDASFDLVVSFETLEHLTKDDQSRFLKGVKRILVPDGLLIISSPDRNVWDCMINGGDNEHHLHELSSKEFQMLLQENFNEVKLFYQNYIPMSVITALYPHKVMNALQSQNFDSAATSAYSIALCSDVNIEKDVSSVYIPNLVQGYVERQLGFVEASLYCDQGAGFCEEHKISAALTFLPDGKFSAVFELPEDATALRFDPGERPCCIQDLEISDKSLHYWPENGLRLQDNTCIFPLPDPIFSIEGRTSFLKGERLEFSFVYTKNEQYAFGQEIQAQGDIVTEISTTAQRCFTLEKELIIAQNQAIMAQKTSRILQNELNGKQEYLDSIIQHAEGLKDQNKTLFNEKEWYRTSYERIHTSTSYRLTAPIRWLMDKLLGKRD